eukprot:TRINITY_DN17190_c0_g2_i2.p2 TRINITY_DN17190_c0_g2~~TRINITY_DN17190_c0_g2_i2.p2  ORF type:complete len:219 (-),score=40.03 TRINITY_DN17190_c0_g2_i2:46-702(-)
MYDLSQQNKGTKSRERIQVGSPDQICKHDNKKIKLTIQPQQQGKMQKRGGEKQSHHGQQKGDDMPSLADLFKPPKQDPKRNEQKEREQRDRQTKLQELQQKKEEFEKEAEKLGKQAKDLKRQMREMKNKKGKGEELLKNVSERFDAAEKEVGDSEVVLAKVLEAEAIKNAPLKDEDFEPFHSQQKIFLSGDSEFKMYFNRQKVSIFDKYADMIDALFA